MSEMVLMDACRSPKTAISAITLSLMEVLAAWLFLFLQLALLYLFWVVSLQAPKPKYSFYINDEVVESSIPDPADAKLDSPGDMGKDGDGAVVAEQKSLDEKAELPDGKSELQIWGQNTMLKWGSEESMERKRSLIIKEITQTEESYLNSLHQLRDIWIRPMTKSAADRVNGLTMKEIQLLSFPSVEMIIAFHDTLLPQLRSTSDIGATFVKFGDFLKMYTSFINSYDNILQVLGNLRNSKKFQSFVQKVKLANPTVPNLESLMIMPIQRIPRYLLLLRELKRSTPEFHNDYPALATAADRIEKITSHINSSKANFENVTKIIQVQNRIIGYDEASLIKAGRLLIHEGHIAIRKQLSGFSPIGRSTTDCIVYLFTDICLWTTMSHKYKGMIELTDCRIESTLDPLDIKLCSASQDVTFVAEDVPSKTLWLAHMTPLLGKAQ